MPNLQAILEDLVVWPGIDGCALVETDTGMAWHHAGCWPEMEQLGEAAIEFWRVQHRLAAHLQALGAMRSVACSFSQRVVALFPCSEKPGLVLVCVAAKGEAVSWPALGQKIVLLQRALAASVVQTSVKF